MAEKSTVAAGSGRSAAAGGTQQAIRPPTKLARSNLRSAAAVGALALFVLSANSQKIIAGLSAENACPQPFALTPTSPAFAAASVAWQAPGFKERAVDWLSGAIRVETETHDDMGHVGDDDRWKKFDAFHDYLERAFPRTHARLSLTKVNTYGLVYEWVGSDPTLKPLAFAAHQDVVPCEASTLSQWVHPPYSGHYDGEFVWGRGAVDDKSSLIGIMSAIETMLEAGFSPRRTVIVASGFDEEIYGFRGAGTIAPFLKEKYGYHGLAAIVDEGGGYIFALGQTVAAFGTAEKGGGNARITVTATGGHASMPHGLHTSIGFLALLISHLEANPHPPSLTRANPLYSGLVCAATHLDLPWYARLAVKGSLISDWLLWALTFHLKSHPIVGKLIGTTQAFTLSSGGAKVNALPETASAVVHHRIGADSSGDAVREHITELVAAKAKELNLTLTSFGGEPVITGPGAGHVVVEEAFREWFDPAAITPTGPDSPAWRLMAGSVRSTFASRIKQNAADVAKGDEIVVTPYLGPFNTDMAHYGDLSANIFRYNHVSPDDFYSTTSLHSVNEALRATGFVELIRFFGTTIANGDEPALNL